MPTRDVSSQGMAGVIPQAPCPHAAGDVLEWYSGMAKLERVSGEWLERLPRPVGSDSGDFCRPRNPKCDLCPLQSLL